MVNGIIAPCIGEACAPYAYETLQKKLEELKSKLIEGTKLLKSLEKQENGSAILNNDAIKWKNDAKEILSKVEINIIKLERHIEATCICGCLPNCRKRRTAKRSILQELQKVEELITRHKPVVKGYRLPENALVQMTRSSDIQEIWYWISQREDVKVVCIHGIPGVGKTAVAEAVCNKALLDNHELFSYVIWVEAYYEITLNNLQEKIMRFLSIEPAPTDDDNDRARKIRDEFVRRKKCLVIIDFLWENFSLRDIGIPEEEAEADGVVCKVILTSRSKLTCPRIPKNEYIEVKPLTESWACYKKNLGPTFSDTEDEAKDLVQKAVEGCDGLPVAIIELAHNVRGMHDQSPNEIALSLKEMLSSRTNSAPSTDAKFMRVKFSYKKLNNTTHKQCFLYCALYPKGLPIKVGQLLDNWIWEGLLDSYIGSLEEKRRQARNVLTALKMARLLEKVDSNGTKESVKMLNLLHDMAVNILCTHKLGVVINSGNDLTEFPPIDDQEGRIQQASFMYNKLGVVKNKPNCPNLSTLLLQNNPLRLLSDDFFIRIPKLKLLDLSYTDIYDLPSSICDLKFLKVLHLRHCLNLRSLPHLPNLKELIVLNLSGPPIEELPRGMKNLIKLERLDLSYTKLAKFPANVVGALKSLQELLLLMDEAAAYSWRSRQSRSNSREACVEELSCLDGLRMLQLNFFSKQELYEYMKAIPSTMTHPHGPRFKFCVGGFNTDGSLGENSIAFIDEYPVDHQLPYGILELYLSACRCSLNPISTLEKTGIDFQHLKVLNLYDCSSLSYLFSLEMLQCLQNLERVYVQQCCSILGIIAPAANTSTDSHNVSSCHLLKLQELVLIDLPELESIYPGQQRLKWPAFYRFTVWNCNQLKRLPLIFNGKYPKVIKLKGKSFKLNDYLHFEHEEARVPEDIVSFVSTKKPKMTSHPMHKNGQPNYFKTKGTEKKRSSIMLTSSGNEAPRHSPGQVCVFTNTDTSNEFS